MNVPSNVKLVKFPELDEVDSALVENAISHFLGKVGSDSNLTLTLKQYKKGGLRAQHELHGKVEVGGKVFFAEFEDWKLLEVIQHVLKVLEKEVKKRESFTK